MLVRREVKELSGSHDRASLAASIVADADGNLKHQSYWMSRRPTFCSGNSPVARLFS